MNEEVTIDRWKCFKSRRGWPPAFHENAPAPLKTRKSESRRSSILKPAKLQQPSQNASLNTSANETTLIMAKNKRRVSFAEKKHVKEFCDSTEQGTLWDYTYEENDSSNSKISPASSGNKGAIHNISDENVQSSNLRRSSRKRNSKVNTDRTQSSRSDLKDSTELDGFNLIQRNENAGFTEPNVNLTESASKIEQSSSFRIRCAISTNIKKDVFKFSKKKVVGRTSACEPIVVYNDTEDDKSSDTNLHSSDTNCTELNNTRVQIVSSNNVSTTSSNSLPSNVCNGYDALTEMKENIPIPNVALPTNSKISCQSPVIPTNSTNILPDGTQCMHSETLEFTECIQPTRSQSEVNAVEYDRIMSNNLLPLQSDGTEVFQNKSMETTSIVLPAYGKDFNDQPIQSSDNLLERNEPTLSVSFKKQRFDNDRGIRERNVEGNLEYKKSNSNFVLAETDSINENKMNDSFERTVLLNTSMDITEINLFPVSSRMVCDDTKNSIANNIEGTIFYNDSMKLTMQISTVPSQNTANATEDATRQYEKQDQDKSMLDETKIFQDDSMIMTTALSVTVAQINDSKMVQEDSRKVQPHGFNTNPNESDTASVNTKLFNNASMEITDAVSSLPVVLNIMPVESETKSTTTRECEKYRATLENNKNLVFQQTQGRSFNTNLRRNEIEVDGTRLFQNMAMEFTDVVLPTPALIEPESNINKNFFSSFNTAQNPSAKDSSNFDVRPRSCEDVPMDISSTASTSVVQSAAFVNVDTESRTTSNDKTVLDTSKESLSAVSVPASTEILDACEEENSMPNMHGLLGNIYKEVASCETNTNINNSMHRYVAKKDVQHTSPVAENNPQEIRHSIASTVASTAGSSSCESTRDLFNEGKPNAQESEEHLKRMTPCKFSSTDIENDVRNGLADRCEEIVSSGFNSQRFSHDVINSKLLRSDADDDENSMNSTGDYTESQNIRTIGDNGTDYTKKNSLSLITSFVYADIMTENLFSEEPHENVPEDKFSFIEEMECRNDKRKFLETMEDNGEDSFNDRNHTSRYSHDDSLSNACEKISISKKTRYESEATSEQNVVTSIDVSECISNERETNFVTLSNSHNKTRTDNAEKNCSLVSEPTNDNEYEKDRLNGAVESDVVEKSICEDKAYANNKEDSDERSLNRETESNVESPGKLQEPEPAREDFCTLVNELKTHAKSDDHIWNMFYENDDKQVLVIGFVSLSLLVVIYTQDGDSKTVSRNIKDVKIVSRLDDETNVLMNIVHELAMKEIDLERLRDAYKYYKDVLPMLDDISRKVKLIMDFTFDLKQLDDSHLTEINSERISFTLSSKSMDIVIKVTVAVKPFSDIRPSDVTVHSILGHVRESDVKELITNVKKDHTFLRRYIAYVKDYISLMEQSTDTTEINC